MKEHTLTADAVTFTEDADVFTLGFVTGQDKEEPLAYLLLQRAATESDVYVELNDQINSGYNLINNIAQAPGCLVLTVNPTFKQLGSPETIRINYPATHRNAKIVETGMGTILKR